MYTSLDLKIFFKPFGLLIFIIMIQIHLIDIYLFLYFYFPILMLTISFILDKLPFLVFSTIWLCNKTRIGMAFP